MKCVSSYIVKLLTLSIFIHNYNTCVFTGKPQVAIINSSPEGLYRNKYNLTWNVKSIQPLTEVRLLFRMMVSFFRKLG